MGTDATGKAGGGSGDMEPEGAGQSPDPDNGRDGTLQPDEAHTDMGKEGYTLVRVISKHGGQKLNQLTGELNVWEVREEFVPNDDRGTAGTVESGGDS